MREAELTGKTVLFTDKSKIRCRLMDRLHPYRTVGMPCCRGGTCIRPIGLIFSHERIEWREWFC